tara:strand:- start:38720 stop:39844 length:1125 start_codon:yes stop_codon:yes gene_type:complete
MKRERGRPVSKPEVEEAYKQLQIEGESPNARAIRKLLGDRGSFSTIQRYLEEIVGAVGGPADEIAKFDIRLNELCEEMVGHINKLADTELQAERAELKLQRELLSEKERVSDHEKDVLKAKLEGEVKSGVFLTNRVSKVEALYAELNKMHTEEISKSAKLVSSLKIETNRADELEHKLSDLRQQRTEYEERVAQQRQAEIEKHQDELATLQKQLVALADLEASSTSEARSLRKQVRQLESDRDSISNNLIHANEKLESLSDAHNVVAGKLEISEQLVEQLRSSLSSSQDYARSKDERIDALNSQVISSQQKCLEARDEGRNEAKAIIRFLAEFANKAYQVAVTKDGPEAEQTLGELQREHSQVAKLIELSATGE